MGFKKLKDSIDRTGLVIVRVTVDGAFQNVSFSCPYTAISKCIDYIDAGLEPVVIS